MSDSKEERLNEVRTHLTLYHKVYQKLVVCIKDLTFEERNAITTPITSYMMELRHLAWNRFLDIHDVPKSILGKEQLGLFTTFMMNFEKDMVHYTIPTNEDDIPNLLKRFEELKKSKTTVE